MQRFAIYLPVLISMGFLTCCSSPLFPHIKKCPPRSPPGDNLNAPTNTISTFRTTAQKLTLSAYLIFKKYKQPIIAILALIFLLIFMRGYYTERKYKYIKIKDEDLGLMKIIRDNAARIWERYRPRENVIWLEDWRK